MSTWAEVAKDFYIDDLTGKTWRVTHSGKTKVFLIDAAGEQKVIDRPAGDRPVEIRYIPPIHTAAELLKSTLGATIIKEIPTHA
jgi:hypothetical protein